MPDIFKLISRNPVKTKGESVVVKACEKWVADVKNAYFGECGPHVDYFFDFSALGQAPQAWAGHVKNTVKDKKQRTQLLGGLKEISEMLAEDVLRVKNLPQTAWSAFYDGSCLFSKTEVDEFHKRCWAQKYPDGYRGCIGYDETVENSESDVAPLPMKRRKVR
mmetsp:Transcript_28297/g.85296  ORF Transcript_28297/g.85296 Transcript_28297/m.85296 type:complete len:163 (-) Transcript_28297:323-811(-)